MRTQIIRRGWVPRLLAVALGAATLATAAQASARAQSNPAPTVQDDASMSDDGGPAGLEHIGDDVVTIVENAAEQGADVSVADCTNVVVAINRGSSGSTRRASARQTVRIRQNGGEMSATCETVSAPGSSGP